MECNFSLPLHRHVITLGSLEDYKSYRVRDIIWTIQKKNLENIL